MSHTTYIYLFLLETSSQCTLSIGHLPPAHCCPSPHSDFQIPSSFQKFCMMFNTSVILLAYMVFGCLLTATQ